MGEVRLWGTGWFTVPNIVLRDLGAGKITLVDYAVYGAVVAHKNRNGLCWPSQRRLADMTGLSRRSVQRALDQLATTMHLEVTRPGDGRQPTVYRVRGVTRDAPGASGVAPLGRHQGRPNKTQEQDSKNKSPVSPEALTRNIGNPIPGYEQQKGRAYPGVTATRAYLKRMRAAK